MKRWILLALLPSAAFMGSCNNAATNGQKPTPPVASASPVIRDTAKQEPAFIDTEYLAAVDFYKNTLTTQKIDVISYKFSSLWDNRDSMDCKNWHPPTQKELPDVLRKFKPTSSVRDYHAHSDFTCQIEGKLKIDNIIYSYTLNAGGYISIAHGDAYMRFCTLHNTALARYFLAIEEDQDYER